MNRLPMVLLRGCALAGCVTASLLVCGGWEGRMKRKKKSVMMRAYVCTYRCASDVLGGIGGGERQNKGAGENNSRCIGAHERRRRRLCEAQELAALESSGGDVLDWGEGEKAGGQGRATRGLFCLPHGPPQERGRPCSLRAPGPATSALRGGEELWRAWRLSHLLSS